MGSFGGNRRRGGQEGGAAGGTPTPRKLEYADDGARSMPSYNSASIADAIRKATAGIVGRSGRTSTNLSGAGTRSYVGSLLGNVN